MNTTFMQIDESISEYYQVNANKKRLESADPVRGAFEGAYFDTKRTIWGMSKNPNNKIIKKEIFEIVSSWYYNLSQRFQCYSLRDFDGSFMLNCRKIIEVGVKYGQKIYFGQAQKIINMFLKYILLVDEKLNCHLNYFHVPLDGVMLRGIASSNVYDEELRKYAKACDPWSRMELDSPYMALQDKLREIYDLPIVFEFREWNRWK